MSQAKVDKYKEEKKNRAKLAKKKRRNKLIAVFAGAAVIGAIIGYPLGKVLYKKSVEKREETATIVATAFDYWSQQYWSANYDEMFDFSAYEADGTETIDATASDATVTDATSTDVQ